MKIKNFIVQSMGTKGGYYTPPLIDTFEDGDYTSNPTWSTTGTVSVDGTAAKNGSYGMHIVNGSASVNIDFSNGTPDKFSLWILATNAYEIDFYGNNGSEILIVRITRPVDNNTLTVGKRDSYEGSYTNNNIIGMTPQNAWFRLEFDGSKINVYNSSDVLTNNTFTQTFIPFTRILMKTTNIVYMDDVYYGKVD
jgi:hypothetical protein